MIKGSNKYIALAKSIEGVYTVETLCERLGISRKKAIYIIHRLRKLGYVSTSYGAEKKRLYYISTKHSTGISYNERINKVSPVKLRSRYPRYVHGRIPSYEEVLVYTLKQNSVRYLIASLALFRKISNWSRLYNLAKKEGLVVEIAVLYDVARKVVKKVRKMPARFINQAEKQKPKKFRYIIQGMNSDDFKDIEKKWNIYIPLNIIDLEDYKR